MKKIILFLCVVLAVFGGVGCSVFKPEEDEMDLTEEDMLSANDNNGIMGVSSGSVSTVNTLYIYTIDSIQEELVPLKVPVGGNSVTPAFIMDEVIRNLDEKVEVTEIDIEKSRIYITFNEDYAPVRKCSENFETMILDCISNSILDNIPYIDEVVFRGEKGGYQSDNFSFEEDEVYSSR